MWTNKAKHSNDSDCDDNYSLKDCESPAVTGESCSSHGGGMTRKRRRGVIEKRRRDRINNSLLELRRLVPAAYEKQGSAKLEKAEILQLTVDHLKTLHAKGLDALAYDPHKFAMDYHSIGFRECAAEVARYLVSVEGMDIQDPLRLRLMSHLQCFAAQRELANKQAATANTWSIPPHPVGGSSYPGSSAIHQVAPMPVPPTATHILPPAAGHQHVPAQPGVLDQAHFNYGMMPENPSFHSNTARLVTTTSPGHQQNHPAAIMSQPTTTMNSAQLQSHSTSPQYANIPTTQFSTLSAQNAVYSSATNGQGRPYRPWGAELAY